MNRFWVESRDGDPVGFTLYRRHYSSSKNKRPKIRQFVGPGEAMVLMGFLHNSLFVWRKQRYRLDGQEGVNCAVFRNESKNLSSDMIREAVEWASQRWPGERLFTMIDPRMVRSRNPGCCFKKAGWKRSGITKKGLIVLEYQQKGVTHGNEE